jgi:4-hydroxybenzoate polyprenyltransferase
MKAEVSDRVSVDWLDLPVDLFVLDTIAQAQKDGRPIWLATAASEQVAEGVASAHGLFDGVISSTKTLNLKGVAKADALVERFGRGGFDYIGNDRNDFHVFAVAEKAYVVRPSGLMRRGAHRANPTSVAIGARESTVRQWLRAMRPHQWTKNLLIVVPAVGAELFTRGSLFSLVVAFAVFSLFASSVYLFNDVLDVHDDRKHPKKRTRPFATGALPLTRGVGVSALFGLTSVVVAFALLGVGFVAVLGFYAVLTIMYSLVLKRVVLLDVFVLAVLYGTRILAGALVVDVPVSPWLIGFSFFAFLSLALVKRYTELLLEDNGGNRTVAGRGYRGSDSPLVMVLGVASTFAATVVLTLYIEDPDTRDAYSRPLLLWALAPVFLLWVSRVWLLAHRGQVDDDPVRFALTDKASYVFLVALVSAWVLAR